MALAYSVSYALHSASAQLVTEHEASHRRHGSAARRSTPHARRHAVHTEIISYAVPLAAPMQQALFAPRLGRRRGTGAGWQAGVH